MRGWYTPHILPRPVYALSPTPLHNTMARVKPWRATSKIMKERIVHALLKQRKKASSFGTLWWNLASILNDRAQGNKIQQEHEHQQTLPPSTEKVLQMYMAHISECGLRISDSRRAVY